MGLVPVILKFLPIILFNYSSTGTDYSKEICLLFSIRGTLLCLNRHCYSNKECRLHRIAYAPPLLLKSCPITLALFLYANHLKNGPIILKQC